MNDADRKLICRMGGMFTRDSVYHTPEGLEIDASEQHEVVRRRVFFDDVQLVTLHSDYGAGYLVATGVVSGFFGFLGILMLMISPDAWPVALVFFAFGSPTFFMFLVRVLFGRVTVTVFGRRSKAVLRFSGARRKRAREIYGQICAMVRRAQTFDQGSSSTTPVSRL